MYITWKQAKAACKPCIPWRLQIYRMYRLQPWTKHAVLKEQHGVWGRGRKHNQQAHQRLARGRGGKMIVGVRSSSVFSMKTLPNTLPEHSLSSLRTGSSYPERGIYVCFYVYSCSQCQDEKLNSRKKAICQGQEAAKQLRLGSKSEPTL